MRNKDKRLKHNQSKSSERQSSRTPLVNDRELQSCVDFISKQDVPKTKWFHHNIRLYDNYKFNGKILPIWLSKITYCHVPLLLSKFIKYEPMDIETPNERNLHEECKRSVRCLKAYIMRLTSLSQDDLFEVQDTLATIYGTTRDVCVEHPIRVPIDNYVYNVSSEVKMDEFPEHTCYKQGTSLNYFYKMMQFKTKKSKQLPLSRVRQIVRSMLKEGHHRGMVLLNLAHKMPVEIEEFCGEEFSWFLPYIHPKIFSHDVEDKLQHIKLMQRQLQSLKDKILNFASEYIAYLNLSPRDKEIRRIKDIENFKKALNHPQIQQLYVVGYAHEKVCDYVYQNCINHATGEFKMQIESNAIIKLDPVTTMVLTVVFVLIAFVFHISKWYKEFFLPKVKFIEESVETCTQDFDALVGFAKDTKKQFGELVETVKESIPKSSNTVKSLASVEETINNLVKGIFTDPNTKVDPKIKLFLIDLKSVCTGIYFVCVGNHNAALSELANLSISHIEMFKNTIHGFYNVVSKMCSYSTAEVDGKVIMIDEAVRSFIETKVSQGALTREMADNILTLENVSIQLHSKNSNTFAAEFDGKTYILPKSSETWFHKITNGDYDTGIAHLLLARRHVGDTTEDNSMLSKVFSTVGGYIQYLTNGINIKDLQLINALTVTCKHALQLAVSATEVCKWIFSQMCLFLFGYDPVNQTVNLLINEMKSIGALTHRFREHQDQLCIDKMMCQDVIFVYNRVLALQESEYLGVVPSHIAKRFNEVEKTLQLLFHQAKACMMGLKTRKEPVVIGFFGKPGSGKSTAMNFLIDALGKAKNLDPNKDHRYTYIQRTKDSYFTNYVGQPFFVYDEMYQSTDPMVRGETSANFIAMKNTVPMNLPMADIGSKGNTFFSSEYIFVTSNYCKDGFENASFNDVGVADSMAIKRRFDMALHRDEPVDVGLPTAAALFRLDVCLGEEKLIGKYIPLKGAVALALRVEKLLEERFLRIRENNIDVLNAEAFRTELDKLYDEMLTKDYYTRDSDIISISDVSSSNGTKKTYTSSDNVKTLEEPVNETSVLNKLCILTNEHVVHYINNVVSFGTETMASFSKICPSYENIKEWYTEYLVVASKTHMEHIATTFAETCIAGTTYDVTTILGVTLGIATVGVAGYFVFDWIFPKDRDKLAMETQTYKGYRVPEYDPDERLAYKQNKYYLNQYMSNRKDIAIQPHRWMGVESGSRVSYVTQLSTNVAACCFYIEGEVLDKDNNVIYAEEAVGFHLEQGVVVVAAHLFYSLVLVPNMKRVVVKLLFAHSDKQHVFDLPQEVGIVENVDIVTFRLPKSVPTPPCCIKYFADKVPPLMEGVPMNIVVPTHDGAITTVTGALATPIPKLEYTVGREVFLLERPITYYGETQKGYSGGLVTMRHASGGVTAVGIHVGACSGRSLDRSIKLAVPIDYSFAKSLVIEMTKVEVNLESKPVFPMEYTINDNNLYKTVRTARKTKIMPSMLHDWIEHHHKIPVDMRIKNQGTDEEFDPIVKGLTKFSQQHFKCDFSRRSEIIAHLNEMYWAPDTIEKDGTTFHIKRRLTLDEALNGIPQLYFKSINLSTSPGIPLNQTNTSGKCPHLSRNSEGRIIMTPEFQKTMEEFLDALEFGRDYEVRFAASGKDELRLVEKVKEGKVRVFCVAPLALIIAQRIFFGMHSMWIHSQCVDKPVAVGLNPHSLEWQRVYQKFAPYETILAGDYQNWDGLVPKDGGTIYDEHVNAWYNNDDSRIRTRIMSYIWEARVQFEDKVIDLKGGCPSGHFGTSDYNSIVNYAMLYEVLTSDLGFRVDEFSIKVYGDDNLIGIKCPRGRVRIKHIAPHIKRRFGMTLTHSSKQDIDVDDDISTVCFIGRKFVKAANGIIRAPLDLEVIKNAVCWVRSSDLEVMILRNTIQSMYVELSHHSPEVFTAITSQLKKFVSTNCNQYMKDLITGNTLYSYEQYKTAMYGPNPKKFETYFD